MEHDRRAADHQDVDDVRRWRQPCVAVGRQRAGDRPAQCQGVGRIDYDEVEELHAGRGPVTVRQGPTNHLWLLLTAGVVAGACSSGSNGIDRPGSDVVCTLEARAGITLTAVD